MSLISSSLTGVEAPAVSCPTGGANLALLPRGRSLNAFSTLLTCVLDVLTSITVLSSLTSCSPTKLPSPLRFRLSPFGLLITCSPVVRVSESFVSLYLSFISMTIDA